MPATFEQGFAVAALAARAKDRRYACILSYKQTPLSGHVDPQRHLRANIGIYNAALGRIAYINYPSIDREQCIIWYRDDYLIERIATEVLVQKGLGVKQVVVDCAFLKDSLLDDLPYDIIRKVDQEFEREGYNVLWNKNRTSALI